MRIQQPTYNYLAFVIFCLATFVACKKEITEVDYNTFRAPDGYELIETKYSNYFVSLSYVSHFPSKEVGYIISNNADGSSLLLKTTDSGKTFKVTFGFPEIIKYLFFIDENSGFAKASGPGSWHVSNPPFCHIYKTMDGGISWDSLDLVDCFSYKDFVLDSKDNLYTLVKDNSQSSLIKSSDFGIHWDTIFTITGYYPLTEIDFFNDQLYLIGKLPQMYILDTNGQVIKTSPFPGHLNSNKLYILDQETYIFEELNNEDYGVFLHLTRNGGQTWNQISELSSMLVDYKSADEFIIYSSYKIQSKLDSSWYTLMQVTDDGGQSYSKSKYKGIVPYIPLIPRLWRDEYFFKGPTGYFSLRKK